MDSINSKDIFELRTSVDALFKHGIIKLEEERDLKRSIDKYEKRSNFFITKPFRTCEAQIESLYMLMRALSLRARDKMREWELSNNED